MQKSKGFPAEKFTAPTTTDNSLSPSIKRCGNSNFCLVFTGSCSKKKKKKKATPPNRIYIYIFIVYELNKWSRDLNSDFTVKDCLFGGDILAKNAGLDKYVYSG